MIWYCQKLYFPQIFFFSLFSPFDFLPHLQTLWFSPPGLEKWSVAVRVSCSDFDLCMSGFILKSELNVRLPVHRILKNYLAEALVFNGIMKYKMESLFVLFMDYFPPFWGGRTFYSPRSKSKEDPSFRYKKKSSQTSSRQTSSLSLFHSLALKPIKLKSRWLPRKIRR